MRSEMRARYGVVQWLAFHFKVFRQVADLGHEVVMRSTHIIAEISSPTPVIPSAIDPYHTNRIRVSAATAPSAIAT